MADTPTSMQWPYQRFFALREHKFVGTILEAEAAPAPLRRVLRLDTPDVIAKLLNPDE